MKKHKDNYVTTLSDFKSGASMDFHQEIVAPISMFYPQRFILLRIVAITSYVVKELSIIIAYWEQKARGHSSLRLKPRAFWLSKIVKVWEKTGEMVCYDCRLDFLDQEFKEE